MPSQFLESPQRTNSKVASRKVYLQESFNQMIYSVTNIRKSIILLQNRGQGAKQVSEVLLARLQTLNNRKNC